MKSLSRLFIKVRLIMSGGFNMWDVIITFSSLYNNQRLSRPKSLCLITNSDPSVWRGLSPSHSLHSSSWDIPRWQEPPGRTRQLSNTWRSWRSSCCHGVLWSEVSQYYWCRLLAVPEVRSESASLSVILGLEGDTSWYRSSRLTPRGHDGSLALFSSKHRQNRVHWDVHWNQKTFLSLSGPLSDFYQGKKKVHFQTGNWGRWWAVDLLETKGLGKGPDVFWCKLNYSFPKIIPELT